MRKFFSIFIFALLAGHALTAPLVNNPDLLGPALTKTFPYSMGGQAELLMLMKQGYTMPKAIEFLRTGGRDLFDPKFYVPPVPVQ